MLQRVVSTRVSAIAENAAPNCIYSTGVSLPPTLQVNAARDWDVFVHAANWKTKLHGNFSIISVGAVVSSQLTP